MDTEVKFATMVMEASWLGFAPGVWPDEFTLDGVTVYRHKDVVYNGELSAVIYGTIEGNFVTILND